MLPNSLKGQFEWAGILTALGYKDIGATLPATVACYECGGALTVYPDIHYTSWFNCSGCKASGDMIQLAMLVLKVDAAAAIKIVRDRGAAIPKYYTRLPTIAVYEKNYLNPRLAAKQLCSDMSKVPFKDNEQLKLLHSQLSIDSTYAPDRWRAMMSESIGHCSTADLQQANKVLMKSVFSKIPPGEHAVVLMFKDKPGRASGLYIISGSGRPCDRVFRPVEPLKDDAGIAFYDNVLQHNNVFGDTAFMMEDLDEVLRLYSRWYKEHDKPLPLGLFYDGKEAMTSKSMWAHMPKKDWVFWSSQPTRSVFAQAAACDGRVLIRPLHGNEHYKYQLWLHKLSRMAKKWGDALEEQMPRLSDAELLNILSNLNLNNEETRVFLHDRSREARYRIVHLLKLTWPVKTVTLTTRGGGRIQLTENELGWFVEGSLITNVRLKVQQIWMQDNEIWARGKIYVKKRAYTFECKEDSLKRAESNKEYESITDVITKALIQGRGPVPVFDPFWIDKLYEVSKLFKRPRMWSDLPAGSERA